MVEMKTPARRNPACGCCLGARGDALAAPKLNRRELFVAAGTAAAAGRLSWAAGPSAPAATSSRRQEPIRIPLRVQPVFNCEIYTRKEATSWRVTGAIQNEAEMREEEGRIRQDLSGMAAAADFPIEIMPLVTVGNVDEAARAARGDFDVLVIYAARRNVPVLEALTAGDRWNLMFVRHRSGPLYYMYIGAHTHFLRKRTDTFCRPAMSVHDIVVDDHHELLWRLRALYALKNLRGRRIVAVGGAGGWGADGAAAPERAQKSWRLDIRNVSYEELGARIEAARGTKALVEQSEAYAEVYLPQSGVAVEAPHHFVVKAFLLYEVFRQLLDDTQADALTVNDCMSTIMPVSGTTACLPLSLLNDDGYLAFCESDFVAIPAGILLHHVAGTPVFLCNPSLPHQGVVTVSHCTAPRRMDGVTTEPVRILTHYESDYGAAPKVEMQRGQKVTVIDADFEGTRWLGFEGEIADNPFFPICRTQLDLKIHGDGERLLEEVRGFHWILAYGSHLREVGYAAAKAGLGWLAVS
jgi:hypothetical protein